MAPDPCSAFEEALIAQRVADRVMTSMEHNSPEALKQYLHEHPDADPSKHKVKKAPPSDEDYLREGLKDEKDPETRKQMKKQLDQAENTRGRGGPSKRKREQDK